MTLNLGKDSIFDKRNLANEKIIKERKEETISIHPSKFKSLNPDTDTVSFSQESIKAEGDGIIFIAPLNFPDGCLIEKFVCYGDAASETETWYFRRIRINGRITETITSANFNTEQKNLNEIINNEEVQYYIYTTSLDTNDEIYGAKIAYTLNPKIKEGIKPIPPIETCFIAGTKILMGDKSEKNIEDIKIRDKVLSYNKMNSKLEIQEVINTKIINEKKGYILINGNLGAIADQPLMTVEGWKRADELTIKDKLFNKDEKYEEIKSIEKKGKNLLSYDLTIKETHDYFANDILAHNPVCP